jgi:hypothetical protein
MRMRSAGDEPLAAIDHQFVAITAHRGLQIGRVAGGHIGL